MKVLAHSQNVRHARYDPNTNVIVTKATLSFLLIKANVPLFMEVLVQCLLQETHIHFSMNISYVFYGYDKGIYNENKIN